MNDTSKQEISYKIIPQNACKILVTGFHCTLNWICSRVALIYSLIPAVWQGFIDTSPTGKRLTAALYQFSDCQAEGSSSAGPGCESEGAARVTMTWRGGFLVPRFWRQQRTSQVTVSHGAPCNLTGWLPWPAAPKELQRKVGNMP